MDLAAAVDRGDLDELQRVIDGCCAARDWEALVELRDRAARAFERGRQLWPTASSAEYRLALEAPAEFAAIVLGEGTGRFALGPLAEVAASTHTWEELAPHIDDGPVAVVTLHERVVRGEDCSQEPRPGPPVLDLPRRLASWEPEYVVATYRSDRSHFPSPELPNSSTLTLPARVPRPGTDAVTDALGALAEAWSADSEGDIAVAAVEGGPGDAIAALGVSSARAAPVNLATAVATMAWAAASGGAFGRRRGAAAGRFDAWWVLAALLGDDSGSWDFENWDSDHSETDGADPEALGDAAASLEWWVWDRDAPPSGWELRLAVTDPRRSRSWAVEAVDRDPTMRS